MLNADFLFPSLDFDYIVLCTLLYGKHLKVEALAAQLPAQGCLQAWIASTLPCKPALELPEPGSLSGSPCWLFVLPPAAQGLRGPHKGCAPQFKLGSARLDGTRAQVVALCKGPNLGDENCTQ